MSRIDGHAHCRSQRSTLAVHSPLTKFLNDAGELVTESHRRGPAGVGTGCMPVGMEVRTADPYHFHTQQNCAGRGLPRMGHIFQTQVTRAIKPSGRHFRFGHAVHRCWRFVTDTKNGSGVGVQ
jgi:hypothetical protein